MKALPSAALIACQAPPTEHRPGACTGKARLECASCGLMLCAIHSMRHDEHCGPCKCGCGMRTARTVRLLREQDRGTAEALGWAETSIAPMRQIVYSVVDGHEGDVPNYVNEREVAS